MNPADFKVSFAGRLTTTPEGHLAFVPNTLPPKLEYDARTVRLLALANLALGRVAGIGHSLPNPKMLMGPFLRREAVLSSRIEGTTATQKDLLLFEAAPGKATPSNDVREVANYVKASQYGLRRLKELPMCLRLIREVHERLMKGVRGAHGRPGEFRQIQNYIGQPGQPIEQARFVPPPVAEMRDALDDLERFLNAPGEMPVLIQLPVAHYQFEAIHPFVDGNGRIGRLLLSLLLCERGLLPQPFLYLSAYFERNRAAYMDHLLRVSQEGSWNEWICFFLQGVVEESNDAIRRIERLLELRQQYREKMQTARASALTLRLVEQLFVNPAITIPGTAKLLRVGYPSAKLIVQRLVKAGILKEVTARKRDRIFCALGVMTLTSAP